MNTSIETYLVTQGDLHERGTRATVEAAIEGGIDVVQLREKHATARERYELGLELREVTSEAGLPLVVNDRIDLAAAIDADGVHLGDDDLPVAVARERLGEDAIVGRSVSSPEAAREAERAGADYLGVGAVFATGTKETRESESEIGLETVRAVREAVDLPFVAIGGITAANAGEVVRAGADGVAVVSAIAAAENPTAATRELRGAIESAEVPAR